MDNIANFTHLSNSELFRALKAIRDEDPDGKLTPPTEQMYEDHRSWAIRTYGYNVWSAYIMDIRN